MKCLKVQGTRKNLESLLQKKNLQHYFDIWRETVSSSSSLRYVVDNNIFLWFAFCLQSYTARICGAAQCKDAGIVFYLLEGQHCCHSTKQGSRWFIPSTLKATHFQYVETVHLPANFETRFKTFSHGKTTEYSTK